MKAMAAILVETGRDLELVDIEMPRLAPGQALVELGYSGVCHTQLLEARGKRGTDPYLPHCLGHEGVGVVREVGAGVSRVSVDDTVILSWIKGTGQDIPGTVYQWDGRKVNAGGVTTFNRMAVVSENRLTPTDGALNDPIGALLGCALPTGMGAVLNTANARAGQSVVVFGAGGVGLCAIVGAALSGCHPIVAVDVLTARLMIGRSVGATHQIDASKGDVPEKIKAICPDGLDIAIEATGKPEVMAAALGVVRPRGGTAVIIGNAPHGQTIAIDPQQLNQGKRLLGTWGGDAQVDRDLPRYARLISDGRVDLDPLIGKRYGLNEINVALGDLERGAPGRPIIDFSVN